MVQKKLMFVFVATLLILALTGSSALACFTIIVGKNVSSTGRVIVGHNEDDGNRAVYRHGLVPAATWSEGTKIPAEVYPAARAPKSEDVPQIPNTFGYYWSEGRETRLGTNVGMSAADAFMNENGVFVATNNNGVTALPEGGYGKQGIVYLLRRSIAERSTSSRHAVLVLAELLRDYGYGQSRAYSIADANEGWMLQVTTGNQYVARRVQDDEIVMMPNFFTIRNIDFSNAKEVAPEVMANDNFIWSKNLVKHAIDNGFYKPANPSDTSYPDFDFAYCYQEKFTANNAPSTWNSTSSTLRFSHGISILTGKEWNTDNTEVTANHPEMGYPFSIKPSKIWGSPIYNGTVGPELIKKVLRSHFEGTLDDPLEERIALPGANPHDTVIRRVCDQTTDESTIVEFGETPALSTVWVAFGRPCEQPYIPLHVMGVNSLPQKLAVQMEDPAKEMAEHFVGKTELSSWKEGDAWWTIRSMQNMLDLVYLDAIDGHTKWLLGKDAELKAANDAAMAFAKSISDQEEQKKFLTEWDNGTFNSVLDSIVEVTKGLNPVEITVANNTVEKAKAATSDELITLKFKLDARKPNPANMWIGVGMTNTQFQGWIQPESVKPDNDGWWAAEFSLKELVGENSFATVGLIDYWLGGRDMTGKFFGGSVVLNVK